MTEIRHILVPTDFSTHAGKAIEHAVELARSFGATVHLLHSYHLPLQLSMPEPAVLPAGFWEDLRKQAETRLTELRNEIEAKGVACQAHASAEPPSQAVLDAAEQLHADLIVMGTRGLTGLKHVLLGSVAERTVRHAPCAVLTVKAED